jgi:uncharacterized membrane protein
MKPRRLPILPTLIAVYRDWGRALNAMRAINLSTVLIITAISVGAEFVPKRLWEQQLSGVVLGTVQGAIWALLLAPFVIALHRFVIRGEITPTYILPIVERSFLVFFGWLFALKILLGLPFDLLGAAQALNWSVRASTLVFAVALVAVAFLSLRLSILLPACAVEAPGATPSRALADTNGEALRIFALFLLAMLPWLAATFGGVILLGPGAGIMGTPRAMISLVFGAIMQTITLGLATVMASYIFLALGAQVKRAAEL